VQGARAGAPNVHAGSRLQDLDYWWTLEMIFMVYYTGRRAHSEPGLYSMFPCGTKSQLTHLALEFLVVVLVYLAASRSQPSKFIDKDLFILAPFWIPAHLPVAPLPLLL